MQEEKMLEKLVDRRQFTVASAMAILSGVAITITACGGGASPSSPNPPAPAPTPTPTPAAADKVGAISDNHGHSAVIGAQLTAGGALSLDIRGSASHTHSVELSAAEIASVAANQRVSKSSSTTSGHDHTVTFN